MSRSTRIAALANVVLWILGLVGLVIVLQKGASPRGLFVILGGGLAVALALLAAVRRGGS